MSISVFLENFKKSRFKIKIVTLEFTYVYSQEKSSESEIYKEG